MAKAVAKSASRSLGLLIVKCKANGRFEFSTFSKIFEALVMSVIELLPQIPTGRFSNSFCHIIIF
jgi:hypothetical protein